MMKTNILYIIEEFVLGGAERVVIDQVLSLNKEKYQAFVCCLRRKGEFAYKLEDKGYGVMELGKKRGLDFSIIPKVMAVMRKHDIQLVHTHLWVANFWGRIAAILAGIPVVITEHNVDVWKPWYYKLMDRILAPFTKRICVVSRQVMEFYQREVGISAKKLEVVYNGIAIEEFYPEDDDVGLLRGELSLRGSIPVLSNIGRLVEVKANHIFIEACYILKRRGVDFLALIVGDGPKKDELAALAQKLSLEGQIIFTGLRKDIPLILSLTDICVLSSVREGLPIIVLEAMAQGIPFVATDVGGNREAIINGETGLLVPSNDPEKLAVAIERILHDADLAKSMRINARKRIIEQFSLEKMMKKYEAIYEE